MSRDLIYRYVKEFTAGRLASGFSHCHRVYHLARGLGVKEYDDDILYAACYLHDTILGTDGYIKSAEKAEHILQEVGFNVDKINSVVECIKAHWPGNNPQSKEGQLLHDANLIDSLGAIGVVRLSAGSFLWYQYSSLKEVLDLIKDYRDKSKFLIFQKSKELAKEKIKFMDVLIKELETEEHL
jgi:HD superfamily phosphodiesterase